MNRAHYIVAIAALMPMSVHAVTDYDMELKRLQNNSERIDAKIQEFGFSVSNSGKLNSAQDKEKPVPLFRIHEQVASLKASTGSFLKGRTLTRLIVGPEGSPAALQLDSDQGLLSGLRILGLAKQASTEGRLFIELDRLVFRTGRVQPIKATVLDTEGAYGLKAQVFSSKALMLAGAMASSFISGFAASQQSQVQTPFGFSQAPATGRAAILQGIGQTAADQSKRLIEESTKEKPVLVVDPGTPVAVYLDEEVRF